MEIATRRLKGRPLCQSDFADLRRLHSDPEAMKTLTASGKPQPEAFSNGFIKRVEATWESSGFGVWAFRTPEEGLFVGYCGLRPYLVYGEPETELLYGLLPDFWGQGHGGGAGGRLRASGAEICCGLHAPPQRRLTPGHGEERHDL